MMLNEEDTRAKLIDPHLREAGWSEELISRSYTISPGRIEVVGETHHRNPPTFADYVLRVSPFGEAVAVIEAKEEGKPSTAGMKQAKGYAEQLGAVFAYSTNGREIEEFDFTTHKQNTIKTFPSPGEISARYLEVKLARKPEGAAEKVFTQPYYKAPGSKEPRYYQESAVSSTLDAITSGRKRLLLNLATGTGKTVIAFNLVWRLVKSGYFKRVLFITDRNFLKKQAYNEFGPFGDARDFIDEGNSPKARDIYFTTYQALYSSAKSGKRVYEEYTQDFFDLVIIDECHRSGFGTWHDILKYFTEAVHLGMTATPKRTDNIDTFAYFGDPIYVYSYGQGVQDGYLAPFVVHRILTDVDKEGKLSLEEAESKGAEIIVPEEEETKDVYSQQEFEKTITLPDRTHQIAQHLAKLLKSFDPMAKTMVFCVDSDHAELVAKELQNLFSDLGFDNFAVPIIARTGDIIESDYERFKDSEKRDPVIATTVDLLTTGVDVPSVRNIVIIKPIASRIVFKQIIGRGSRLDPITDKHYFRIIDYVGSTRLFDEWESPPEPPEPGPEGSANFFLSGMIIDAETEEPIQGAMVILQRKSNEQISFKTGKDGRFHFEKLPQKEFHLSISAYGYRSRGVTLPSKDNPKEFSVIALQKKGKAPRRKVIVQGLPVYIAEEERLFLEREGKMLKAGEYIEYAGKEIVKKAASLKDLSDIWIDPKKREDFLSDLAQQSIHPEVLRELLERADADGLDLIAHAAFRTIVLSRDERVEAMYSKQQEFLKSFPEGARDIVFALLEKYRRAGIEEIENPLVFDLPPFDRMGKIDGAIKRFGGTENLRDAIGSVRKKLYVTND